MNRVDETLRTVARRLRSRFGDASPPAPVKRKAKSSVAANEGIDRPIIVVGCARSGTTLLQSMIHAHPRLAMPPENRFMMPLYNQRIDFGDLREPANVEEFGDALVAKGTKIKDMGLSRSKVRNRLWRTPPTIGSFLGSVLVAYAELHGKARWGDKRPNYIQALPAVLELFPDAQIVHIIRDGRDSAASLLTMPWWNRGFGEAVYKWRDAVEAGNDAKADFAADSYHEFRYEDLVADPQATLTGLCEFLGEEFHPDMLEPHRVAGLTPDYKVWHEGLQKPVNEGAVQRFQRDLSADQIALFELVAGDQLRQHGYPIVADGAEPGREVADEWAEAERRMRKRDKRRKQRDAEVSAAYDHPVAAILTSGQRERAAAAGWLADYEQPVGKPRASSSDSSP